MNNTSRTTEVIVSVSRRRRFTAEQKAQIVEESLLLGNSISETARKYDIQPCQIYTWRRFMKQGQDSALSREEKVYPESEKKILERRIKELERALGKQTLRVECLKEAVRIGREKKLISRAPLPGLEDFE